ncbi:MAG: polysaccharide deacetylase family protein [Polyangiaceae bacterium]|nr:polysaccharide deacetylase family protein [Polyangiaceae bacterium]MCW5791537.1 polysaccharide deacetylase family protein [Polyangiaceae bacterium]
MRFSLLASVALLACSANQPPPAAEAPALAIRASAPAEAPRAPDTEPDPATPDATADAPGAAAAGAPGATADAPSAEPTPAADAGPRFREPVVDVGETRAVVLLYHGFDRGKDPLSVASRHFREQMVWLRENQVEAVWPSQLVRFLRGELRLPRRVAVITIDDGMASVYSKAWPILRELGVPFSLGITTALVEERHREAMRWPQIEEMLASGLVEIASHGHRHRGLANVSRRLLDEELERSRELLEQRLGVTPRVYYYPLGSLNSRVRDHVLSAGYEAAFTATGAPIAFGSAHLGAIPRTSVFYGDTLGQFGWLFRGFVERVKPSVAAASSSDAR